MWLMPPATTRTNTRTELTPALALVDVRPRLHLTHPLALLLAAVLPIIPHLRGELSQIPRSGELPSPPARSQGSKVASSRWLSDCHCHRLYLAGSREMIRCAATATCVES